MLAFCQALSPSKKIPADRIAASLGLFDGGVAASERDGECFYCFSSPGQFRKSPISARGWRVSRSESGGSIMFDGWFDNLADVARQLDCAPDDPAKVYGEAVARWGDQADRHVIGQYCAIYVDKDGNVRLSRSPINAPPLVYCIIDGLLVVASVARVLLAAGLPVALNERKLVDSLFMNLTGNEGWYEGSHRVDIGTIVHHRPGRGLAPPVRYFDVLDIKPLSPASDEEYLEEAERLLGEAALCAVRGSSKPGVFLSGGLDSSNVAARVLQALPGQQPLPSFTFVPAANWDGIETPRIFGDERPYVEAFARQHSRIKPHFIDNAGRNFDYGLEKLFMAMGSAPPNLPNVWMHHGIYESAQDAGCDLLLSSDLGNQTFSAHGQWAAAEYFRTGQWRQAWLTVRQMPFTDGPVWLTFLRHCLATQLGDKAWHRWQRLKGKNELSANELVASLQPGMLEKHSSVERARDSGVLFDRPLRGTRKASLIDGFARGDFEAGDVRLGFEQIYGIKCRDVTAYRPLVEFCAGLPTRMFMRDGQSRWLARQLAIGRMPETQRQEERHGFHNADWHARTTPQLPQLREEAARGASNKVLGKIIDYNKVLKTLDKWPEESRYDRLTQYSQYMGLPRAITMSRYVKHVYGWND